MENQKYGVQELAKSELYTISGGITWYEWLSIIGGGLTLVGKIGKFHQKSTQAHR